MLFLNFKTFLHLHEDAPGLGVKTLSVAQIADKHGIAIGVVERQLDKGIAIEREHTKDSAIAREIALDHLAEVPDYYDKLKSVEEDADPCWSGYQMVGMKTKNGQRVPNCVPENVEEDAPANAAGNGAVAGLGIGPQGEPGVLLPRRKHRTDEHRTITEQPNTFANADVFDVSPDTVFRLRGPKLPWQRYQQFVGEDPDGESIRQHARKRWSRDIILRDSRSGVMTYLRRKASRRAS